LYVQLGIPMLHTEERTLANLYGTHLNASGIKTTTIIQETLSLSILRCGM